MVVRKCHKCEAVWHSGLKQCVFCGQDGEEQAPAHAAVAVLDRTNGTSRLPETDPEPAAHPDEPAPAPAPRLPSALVPPVFGLLGLAAAVLLPAAVLAQQNRIAAILLFLGVALLAPFGPLGWWAGWRYEVRCRDLGFLPSGAARAGRVLGVAVTMLVAVEGSVLAFLRALQRLQE